jgi:uncharacterized protein YrrD
MNKIMTIFAALAFATAASAQTIEIKKNAPIFSSEGVRLGKVDQVISDKDGKVQAVKLIFDGHFVAIPVSTLTKTDKGIATSLTRAEIRKL